MIFFLVSGYVYAAPLSIVPKEGVTLPTEIISGYDVQAYYTITNNTRIDFYGLYVSNLPKNVSQVTNNHVYPDSCGSFFDLAAGESKTLQLVISAPVDSQDKENFLFISLIGGKTGFGTIHSLSVVETPWDVAETNEGDGVPKFEILDVSGIESDITSFTQALVAGGDNPMTLEVWENYTPPAGYFKNTSRYVQFQENKFIASSGSSNGQTTYITTDDGYTWFVITRIINAMWPFNADDYEYPSNQGPFHAGNYISNPPAGVVKLNANYKGQIFKFYANEGGVSSDAPGAIPMGHYVITDQWGNKHIMIASDFATRQEVEESFLNIELPEGWINEIVYFEEDLELYPSVGPYDTYEYTFFRDNAGNSYHQYYFATTQGITLCSQVEGQGMPIWGGLTDGPLTINNGFDNFIYGGGGIREFIFPSLTNIEEENGGINTILDFNPVQGDRLNFDNRDYEVVITQFGTKIDLFNEQSQAIGSVILSQFFLWDDAWVITN